MGTRFVVTKSISARLSSLDERLFHSYQWHPWLWFGLVAVLALPMWALSGYTGVGVLIFVGITGLARTQRRSAEVPQANTILVVGSGPRALALAAALGMEPLHSGLTGTIFTRTQTSPPRVVHAHTWEEAQGIVPRIACDRVVMLDRTEVNGQLPADSRGQAPLTLDSYTELERVLGRVPLEFLEVSGNSELRSLHRSNASIRRGLDLIVALPLALIVGAIVPFIAALIVLESRGPVFYSQSRVGLGGKLFRIYKFRSMRSDAEALGATWATTNDNRVTRVGRFLRSTRIDELPQVWNIIRGDMSLIGPRPERPEFTAIIEQQIPAFRLRTRVKPGITGWAQICVGYGRSINDSRTKLEYDLYYVTHNSLLFNLKILLHTIPVVIGRKGS